MPARAGLSAGCTASPPHFIQINDTSFLSRFLSYPVPINPCMCIPTSTCELREECVAWVGAVVQREGRSMGPQNATQVLACRCLAPCQ